MHLNLLPYTVLWCVLALAVIFLIFWRKAVARHEDDTIHLDSAISKQQVAIDHKLTVIDRWGKSLTILTLAFGLLIALVYLYQGWNAVPTY